MRVIYTWEKEKEKGELTLYIEKVKIKADDDVIETDFVADWEATDNLKKDIPEVEKKLIPSVGLSEGNRIYEDVEVEGYSIPDIFFPLWDKGWQVIDVRIENEE